MLLLLPSVHLLTEEKCESIDSLNISIMEKCVEFRLCFH